MGVDLSTDLLCDCQLQGGVDRTEGQQGCSSSETEKERHEAKQTGRFYRKKMRP